MTVDKKVSEYEEVNWGPSMASTFEKRSYSALGGMEISADEAKQKVAEFLKLPEGTQGLEVAENGAGTEFSSYSVRGKNPYSGQDMHVDVSKKGGHIIYYISARDITERNVDLKGAQEAASDFVASHGYDNMVPVSYDEYANVASFTFAHRVGDVTIYPERVVVKVALDNAEITGLAATDYIYEHKPREIPAPALTLEQAKKSVNPSFKTESASLAWIKNDLDQEVLCYELIGRINGTGYRMYINADTGIEERIEEFTDVKQATS